MADSSAIRAGKAFVELSADDNKLTAGLAKAAGKVKAFGAAITQIGASFSALGGTILTPIMALTRDFAELLAGG